MGRHQNAIVRDFFHRGQKLDDSSNRYKHDCQKCGEHFAKGRVDSMVNHLVKNCPGMTQEDRDLVFLHMQNSGASANSRKRKANAMLPREELNSVPTQFEQQQGLPSQSQNMQSEVPAGYHHGGQPELQHSLHQGVQSDLPLSFLLDRQESALDTLAEVSRRHLDYSHGSLQQRSAAEGHAPEPLLTREQERSLVEQALLTALQRPSSSHQQAPLHGDPNAMPGYSSQESQNYNSFEASTTNAYAASPLVQTATAANQQLEMSQQSTNPSNQIDPQLNHTADASAHAPPRMSDQPATYPDFMTWSEAPQNFVTQQSLPSDEPTPGFGMLQKADKLNARARFTESRRQEVQENRKRGACLRCRMLKKSCSDGQPCGACKKIESARLWKSVCIRTRIADEFPMFASLHFQSRSNAVVSAALQGSVCQHLPGEITVKLCPGSECVATFAAVQCSANLTTAAVETSGSAGQDDLRDNGTQNVVVLDGTEEIATKVAEYCAKDSTINACLQHEKSTFMKKTFLEARALLEAEEHQHIPYEPKKRPQNFIAPSMLQKQVIELWVRTSILASSTSADDMEMHCEPEHQPHLAGGTGENDQSSKHFPPGSSNHRLITAQLLAATESRADRLCKTVLNELERRLLQRQQVSAFGTFISAVILLNCVERMTALFKSLDSQLPTLAPDQPLNTQVSAQDDPQIFPSADPAQDQQPQAAPPSETANPQALPALWQQGSHFANLITLLLRLRALPPKTTRTATNKLAVLNERALPVRVNGRPIGEHQDEDAEKAAKWLDPMELDFDAVAEWKNGRGAGEGWRAWDGVFVGPLLVGEMA